RNDEIKLHGTKAPSGRLTQTMLGHFTAYPRALCIRCDHESGVGNMRAAPSLVGPQDVSANDDSLFHLAGMERRCRPGEAVSFPYRFPIIFRDVSERISSKPISERLFAGHFQIERVGIARRDDLLKNIPDRLAICFDCCPDFHHRQSTVNAIASVWSSAFTRPGSARGAPPGAFAQGYGVPKEGGTLNFD